jgi:hypothetical protein
VRRARDLASRYGYLSGSRSLPAFPEATFPLDELPEVISTSEVDQALLNKKDWIEERLKVGWRPVTVWEELDIKATRSSFYRFLTRHNIGSLGEKARLIPEIRHRAGAGGGGGLDHSNIINKKVVATCTSGGAIIKFVDVTYNDSEEGDFVSSSILIDQGDGKNQKFLVWYGSFLKNAQTDLGLNIKKVALMDFNSEEAYFDISVDFNAGSGEMSAARYAHHPGSFYPPFLTLHLENCRLN